jgi:Holliday junction resolvasome RuvABC DNA-binding subunit
MTNADDRAVTAISGIGEKRADALAEAGFETVGDVHAADSAALTDAEGIGERRADDLMGTVEEMVAPAGTSDTRDVTAISGIADTRATGLRDAGFETVGDVRAADPAALTDAEGIGEKRAATLMSAVEEMEAKTPADSPSGDTDEHERAPVQPSPDADTEAGEADEDTPSEDGTGGVSRRGAFGRMREKMASAVGSPHADGNEAGLTSIGTVREQRAAALREAGFETLEDVASTDQTALAAVDGVDNTNAGHIQRAAEQKVGGGGDGDPDTDSTSGDTDTAEDTEASPPTDADTTTDEGGSVSQTDGDTESAGTIEDTEGSDSGGIGTKSLTAAKTAARAVVNPASVVQDDEASGDENATAPASDDGQQLSEEAIAELAQNADMSPSQARRLIQEATENENVALTADDSVATAPATTDSSDLSKTYAADLIAPASLRLRPASAQTSDVHTKVIYVEGYPEFAEPKMFERLFAEADHVDVDTSIHIGSHDRLDAIGHVQDAIEDLQVLVAEKEDESDVTVRDSMRRLEGHEDVYDSLSSGRGESFDVGFYIVIRGNEKDDVDDASKTIETKLKTKQITVKKADYAQQDGLMAGSPLADDQLARTDTMLGGAVGAMYPFSSSSLIEPSGVLAGYHALTDAPIVFDRYERSNYNMVVAGELGAGKSFNTKMLLLRMLARDPDTIVIVIDPRGEFEDLVRTLGGNRISVGGESPINPLEIEAIPEQIRGEIDDLEYNPFKQARSSAMETFDSYFKMNSTAGGESFAAERRAVLGFALDVTYAMCGFTSDPATHTNQSPVIPEVRSVLGAINRNPRPFIQLSNRPLEVTPDVVDELPGIDVSNRRVTAGSAPEDAPVTVLSDLGENQAEQLETAGIETLGDLSDSDPPTVARAADVPPSEADGWLEQAVTPEAYAEASTSKKTATAAPDGGTTTESPGWMDDTAQENIAEQTVDDWSSHASGLKISLAPFRPGGALGHLGQPTDIDITDSRVTYLDFQASDTETEMSLMTKVLFNAIYERAKTTDKRVVLPIDEAWRLIKNSESLTWLEQGTRFSRHHDLSIQYITQTLDEFYEREEGKFIINNSATKMLHNLDGGLTDEQANHLDLTEREANYVNTATMGETGAGYSQALLMVKEEGNYPLRVEALPEEVPLIDPEAAEEMNVGTDGGVS